MQPRSRRTLISCSAAGVCRRERPARAAAPRTSPHTSRKLNQEKSASQEWAQLVGLLRLAVIVRKAADLDSLRMTFGQLIRDNSQLLRDRCEQWRVQQTLKLFIVRLEMHLQIRTIGVDRDV